MGSYSSSSSSSTNIDKRQVVDANAIGVTSDGSSSVQVNVLDAGAIDKAFAFALNNTEQLGDTFEKMLSFTEQAIDLTADNAKFAEMATKEVGAAYAAASENASGQKMILYGLLALGALYLLRRRST